MASSFQSISTTTIARDATKQHRQQFMKKTQKRIPLRYPFCLERQSAAEYILVIEWRLESWYKEKTNAVCLLIRVYINSVVRV